MNVFIHSKYIENRLYWVKEQFIIVKISAYFTNSLSYSKLLNLLHYLILFEKSYL